MTPGDLERRIAGLFPLPVAVAVAEAAAPQPPLMAPEEAAIARAVPARRAEFTAGRAAARAAMARLGLPPLPIPAHEDRSPIWPPGVTGSISHAGGICVAVAMQAEGHALGLDIELAGNLEPDLWPLILTARERAEIGGAEQGRLAQRIFGIKEAAYKAQYPVTGALFGFQALEVTGAGTAAPRVTCTEEGAAVPGLRALFPAEGRPCACADLALRGRALSVAAIALPWGMK